MKKTNRMAQITQYLCGNVDRIERRVWTDGTYEYVKVEGMWHKLSAYYRSNHHTVETWWQPATTK